MQQSPVYTEHANFSDLRRQTNPDLFTEKEARDILYREGFRPTDNTTVFEETRQQIFTQKDTHVVAMLMWFGPNDAYIFRRMGHMDNIQ